MKIGPKYKIARRLGAPVFEKTQTQKYTLSQAKKSSQRKTKGRPSQMTDFGKQLREKQKARYTYLLSEKQFSKYVKSALSQKSANKAGSLFELLENRLDNLIWRARFAPTRLAARQIVSHGHITVNGRKTTIPSYIVRIGDKITIRPQSLGKGVFKELDKNLKEMNGPDWVKVDADKKEIEISAKPDLEKSDNLFDLETVLEFYSR